MKKSPRTIVALTALSMLAITTSGCTSGASWPNLAWWKKTPPNNSMASYPKPPAGRFTPKSVTTPGVNEGKGYSDPKYLGSNTSRAPGDYPSTEFGGASYDAGNTQNRGASYNAPQNDQPDYRAPGGGNSSDRGYYSIPPRSGATGGSDGLGSANRNDDYLTPGNRTPDSGYVPKGGFDNNNTADLRNGPPASRGFDNSPPASNEGQWNPNPGAAPWDSKNYGEDFSAPSQEPYSPKGTRAPWDDGASSGYDRKFDEQADNRFQPAPKSFDNGKSSGGFDTGSYGKNDASSPQLPASLSEQKGGYQPGSTKKNYNVAPASGGLGSRRDSSFDQGARQVDYEELDYADDYPGNLPPAGAAFSNGSLDRGMNDFNYDR